MKHDTGWMEVICGSMFSGKSEELIRRLRRARIARQNVMVFKPGIDKRYNEQKVISHNGIAFEAIPIQKSGQIPEILDEITTVVGIDEAQFIDDGVIEVAQTLANNGLRVIIAGLDMDFRGEPFGCMPVLMAIAEKIDKLQAICMTCGGPASRTQRLVNGNPAKFDDPIVIVGAAEMYEARCRDHHEVPRN